jgi:hypothetical protein
MSKRMTATHLHTRAHTHTHTHTHTQMGDWWANHVPQENLVLQKPKAEKFQEEVPFLCISANLDEKRKWNRKVFPEKIIFLWRGVHSDC